MNHTVYFLYFGDGKYRRLIAKALEHYLGAGLSRKSIAVLTDLTTPIEFGFAGFELPVKRVDPAPYTGEFMRRGHHFQWFDYKSCVLMALIAEDRPTPCFVLDIDNLVRSDFSAVLDSVPGQAFAISPDFTDRMIPHPAFNEPVQEHCTSGLVFPAACQDLIPVYQRMWREMPDNSNGKGHNLLEQRTWNCVWHAQEKGNQHLLPRSMAWCPGWGPEPANVKIVHMHGAQKWN